MKKPALHLILIISLASSGCSSLNILSTPMPTATPEPTSTPTIEPPNFLPKSGFSNIYGRVIWRGDPLKGFYIKFYSPVDEVVRWGVTDNEGVFIIENVPGGDFVLKGDLTNSDLENIAYSWKDSGTIPVDVNYNYGEYRLLEANIKLLAPVNGVEIDDTQPTLRWEPYPGAAYYTLTLKSESGRFIDLSIQTTSPEYKLLEHLIACHYLWDVIAIDETGRPLACTNDPFLYDNEDNSQLSYGFFKVNNDEIGNCHIIVYNSYEGNRVTFEWETQPLVVRYHLRIIEDAMVGGISTQHRGVTFFEGDLIPQEDGTIKQPKLPNFKRHPVTYEYYIDGFDKDDRFIASSGWRFLFPSF